MPKAPSKNTALDNPFMNRKYIRAVGRRKSAVARVKIYTDGTGLFTINHRPVAEYFGTGIYQDFARAPLAQLGQEKAFDVNAAVVGGGIKGQSQAVQLALARALVVLEETNKPALRQTGLLTVDARVKERKKPGLKRARRAPQWQKR